MFIPLHNSAPESFRVMLKHSFSCRRHRSFILPVIIILGLTSLITTPADSATNADTTHEHQIKAAFIFNFMKFTRWPHLDTKTLSLCAIGKHPINRILDGLTGKKIGGLPLVFKQKNTPEEMGDCRAVFVGQVTSMTLKEIHKQAVENSLLTISDQDHFAENGGVINFIIVNNKVRFTINILAAKRQGIKINARLLDLAVHVLK